LWYYLGSKNTYIDNGENTRGGTVFVSKMLLANTPKKSYELAKIISTDTRNLAILQTQKDIEMYAQSISTHDKNIYILLHRQMLRNFFVFGLFGDRDLKSGQLIRKRQFQIRTIRQYDKANARVMGDNFTLDLNRGILHQAHQEILLHAIVSLEQGIVQNTQRYHAKSQLVSVLYEGQAITMDRESFNTLLIQGMLQRVEGDYFRKILSSRNFILLKLN